MVPERLRKDRLADIERTAAALDVPLVVAPAEGLETLAAEGLIYRSGHISPFAFSKLLFAEVLTDLDEVVYLDVDTLIRAPLDELLSWELTRPLGAVQVLDPGGAHLFGTTREPYFNSGVLRLSLERMRQERIWGRAKEILLTHDKFLLVEQDVLNIIFRRNFDVLPTAFNAFDDLLSRYGKLAVLHDPVIVHFRGPRKPWHQSSESIYAREWRSDARRFQHRFPPSHDPGANTAVGGKYARNRAAGRGRVGSVARTVLPESAKRVIKATAAKSLRAAQIRIDLALQRLSCP